jgi:hypothetical protein
MGDPAAWFEWAKVAAVIFGLLFGSAAIGSPSWGSSGYGTSASKLRACLQSQLKDGMTKNPAFGMEIKNLTGENLPPDDLEIIEQVVAKDGSGALVVAWRVCKKEARTETLFFDHSNSQYAPQDQEYTLQDMKSDAGEDCSENRNNTCACVLANATEMPSEPFEEWCDAHHLATGSPRLAPISSRRGPDFALVCFENGQQLSVIKKICYYNCAGSAAAITVPVAYVCPISIQR